MLGDIFDVLFVLLFGKLVSLTLKQYFILVWYLQVWQVPPQVDWVASQPYHKT
jgi:hypothetical protein